MSQYVIKRPGDEYWSSSKLAWVKEQKLAHRYEKDDPVLKWAWDLQGHKVVKLVPKKSNKFKEYVAEAETDYEAHDQHGRMKDLKDLTRAELIATIRQATDDAIANNCTYLNYIPARWLD